MIPRGGGGPRLSRVISQSPVLNLLRRLIRSFLLCVCNVPGPSAGIRNKAVRKTVFSFRVLTFRSQGTVSKQVGVQLVR